MMIDTASIKKIYIPSIKKYIYIFILNRSEFMNWKANYLYNIMCYSSNDAFLCNAQILINKK